ncbi:TraB/GumN family protein [Leptolyngbya sp. 15MV]|nr:TraB/GumN family protein [Leptolyngbya sp. 15MV]
MNKFTRRLSLAVSGMALLLASGCATVAPAPEASAAATSTGPALWKVADADTTIYLFGTVHVLPDGIDWFGPRIAQALAASDTLVTEIPVGAETEARMQQLVLSTGMLPEGGNLREQLGDENRTVYEGALGKLGLPVNAFDRFEPWMAGLTLTILPLLQQGYSPESGVEKQLEGRASATMTREALETVEYQIGIFDSMPQDAQVGFLMSAATMVDETKASLDAMVAHWLAGDADALAALMNEELGDPAVAEALLYTRNANWARDTGNRGQRVTLHEFARRGRRIAGLIGERALGIARLGGIDALAQSVSLFVFGHGGLQIFPGSLNERRQASSGSGCSSRSSPGSASNSARMGLRASHTSSAATSAATTPRLLSSTSTASSSMSLAPSLTRSIARDPRLRTPRSARSCATSALTSASAASRSILSSIIRRSSGLLIRALHRKPASADGNGHGPSVRRRSRRTAAYPRPSPSRRAG